MKVFLIWMVALFFTGCLPAGGGGGSHKDGGSTDQGAQTDGGAADQGIITITDDAAVDAAEGADQGPNADQGPGADQGPDATVCEPSCAGRVCGPDGCGGDCGPGCAQDEICDDGACSSEGCPDGQFNCGGVCSNLVDDAENCGNCGNACPRLPDAVTTCVDAECFLGCPGQRSVDFENDPQHCGGCATVCPTAVGGQAWCAGGQCGPPCLDNDLCSGVCVDTSDDNDNCGACGHVCPGRSVCQGGACLCWNNETLCEDGCHDLDRDVNNCGVCGNVCPSPQGGEVECDRGECADPCSDGFVLGAVCGGACVDLDSDADHCSECGNSCDATFAEVNGRDCVRNTGGDCSGEVEGCAESTCLYRAEQTWNSNSRGDDVSCSAVCARHGLRCGEIPLNICPNSNPEWQEITFDDNPIVAGCVIYSSRNGWGPRLLDCDTTVVSEEGGPYYAHRRVMNCWCVADEPDEPVDPVDALDAPGSYPMDHFSQGEHTTIPLHMNAERRVTIFTGDGEGGCPADTILRLFDDQGALLVEDDDGGFDVCSRIGVMLSPGDYRIEVHGYGGDPVPDYVLTLDW